MIKYRIAITTGDTDGVGLEVAAKALAKLKPIKNVQFILWRSVLADKKYLKVIDRSWERVTVNSLDEALKVKGHVLIDIASQLNPAQWVVESAKACLGNKLSALATGPLSKITIKKSGLNDLGHTDILKRISHVKNVNMGFVGKHFNVVLATDHIAINEINGRLDVKKVCAAIKNTNSIRPLLPSHLRNKPIGILGLNPHAGEGGLIGIEEGLWIKHIGTFAKKNNIPIVFPLVPDAAFLKNNWRKYSVFLALYHDQGLIPFKMAHGQDSGVHITLGIPFIRTSVDHGTANDIAGMNIANPNSMLDAIRWAVKLARLKT